MNSLSVTGNIGRDAQTREAGNSTVTQFSVAVTSGYGSNEITTWLNAQVWGKRGQSLEPHLLKGQQVALVGELTNRPYKDKQGQEKFSLEVNVNDLTLIGGKGSSASSPSQNKAPAPKTTDDFDDLESIPF